MDYLLYNNIRNIVKNDLKNINSSLIGGGFDKLPTEDFQKHVIKLLNQYGLDINEKFGDKLPIEFAIQYRSRDFIKELIKFGCNIKNLE